MFIFEHPKKSMTQRFHSLRIIDIRKETADCVSIAFHVPTELISDYEFRAGQYLTLKAIIEGEEIRRAYSLCSAPFEKEWRIAVKRMENGKFSTYANSKMNIGDYLEVSTPSGNFKINETFYNYQSVVLFAAGSGITPIISIVKELLKTQSNSFITLFYGNKGLNDVIFREQLENLKNQHLNRLSINHIFSRENTGNAIQYGRINRQKTLDIFNSFLSQIPIDKVFICGPDQMIFDVKETLIELGIKSEIIHFELFKTQISKKNQEERLKNDLSSVASNVQAIIDGNLFEFNLDSNGISILDAALNLGVDMPYACKGGVCCTCKAKTIQGSVKMNNNYALSTEEVESGYILTCQAHPTSEKVVVSFDE
jgi:ring-1,2-phenylacetyl-CoA epoxidase subunit PaaE